MSVAAEPRSWTRAVRRAAVRALPPDRLLPDTQPVYVASWIYVFGVLTIASLIVVLVSGAVLALEGPAWWHDSKVGLFFNSLHLWSVELFFFFMVIHLWGKFLMAAWRGRRGRTWVTGMIAFLASIGTAFTGYLSQQNFASQWISTQAKDGLNSVGIGAFFNVLNFGQMLMFHILLLPALLGVLVILHVLLVRHRGVVPPLPAKGAPQPTKEAEAAPWTGPSRSYDLVREFIIAVAVVSAVTVLVAALFSSPDVSPVTIRSWSSANPRDFLATAVTELDGTSGTAAYGPPYNATPDASQKIGPVDLQSRAGVRIPVDTAQDLVLGPLAISAVEDPGLSRELASYDAAAPVQRTAWTDAYTKALGKASVSAGAVTVPAGNYGPVGSMMTALLTMARSGGLDGALLSSRQFYQTDYTKPLLFIADGSYIGDLAAKDHLNGDQWGMMNESGNYPGQPWLWLYTFWYQIPPFSNSGNADALIWALMMVLTLVLILVPYLPGIRAIPKRVKIYRLIWRTYYREVESEDRTDARSDRIGARAAESGAGPATPTT